MPERDDTAPHLARLDEKINAIRDRNRDEHDHLGEDLEDVRDGQVAFMKELTEHESRLTRLETIGERLDRAGNNWPNWLIAAGTIATLAWMVINRHG